MDVNTIYIISESGMANTPGAGGGKGGEGPWDTQEEASRRRKIKGDWEHVVMHASYRIKKVDCDGLRRSPSYFLCYGVVLPWIDNSGHSLPLDVTLDVSRCSNSRPGKGGHRGDKWEISRPTLCMES